MSWLVAVLVAIGILTVFNTALCFAVIARLRAGAPARTELPDIDSPRVGTTIDRFTTVATDGEPLTAADVATSVTLFLSPGCGPCREAAQDLAVGGPLPDRVFAFVLGDHEDEPVAQFAASLPPWVRVSYVQDGDAVTTAFGGVAAYPALLRLQDGTVTAHAVSVADLAGPRLVDR